ncbi:MAG: lipid-A-disaccharide synthase [Prevotella sp.]|nr:lipid-A-disaccharide synthase [Prevotella sp.]
MKYYLIVGEASGDLHASHLMKSLQQHDPEVEFRFFGGDLMTAVGGTRVRHFRELAYMGFVPVLLHLPTILRNMRMCKRDIAEWQPDAVVLVDYPGFNLSIAKYVHSHRPFSDSRSTQVFYYISPKIWAWKEYRIKSIRRDVDELFSILPFEVPFFEQKHQYPIHYVGNPTADEVRSFKAENNESLAQFVERMNAQKQADSNAPAVFRQELDERPIIALLAGSRQQEIKDNLPAMIEATRGLDDYQLVLAGAPSIDDTYYEPYLNGSSVRVVRNQTYALLAQATAALVTSGTATLETALFGVPQVVCYKTPVPKLVRFVYNHVIKCRFISLVNLIADREVVPELLADRFSVQNIRTELNGILPGGAAREAQISGYRQVAEALGTTSAPDNAARQMLALLK